MTEKKLILIIKSRTFHEAKSAANKRGIHITDLSVSNTTSNEFRARTSVKNFIPVQQWFKEEPQMIPRFGYPAGTLLYFRQEQDQSGTGTNLNQPQN